MDGFLTSVEFSLSLGGSSLSGVHPMRDRSYIMSVFNIIISSFLGWVVEVGLAIAGVETNRTVLGSVGEVIVTSGKLSSGGLSLSIIHSKDGSVMVKSVKIDQIGGCY